MTSTILLIAGALIALAAIAGAIALLFVLLTVPAKWSQREANRRIHQSSEI